jgi:hypothetical protein
MFKFGLLLEHSDSKDVNVLEHESVKVEAFRLKTTFPRGKMFCKQKTDLKLLFSDEQRRRQFPHFK